MRRGLLSDYDAGLGFSNKIKTPHKPCNTPAGGSWPRQPPQPPPPSLRRDWWFPLPLKLPVAPALQYPLGQSQRPPEEGGGACRHGSAADAPAAFLIGRFKSPGGEGRSEARRGAGQWRERDAAARRERSRARVGTARPAAAARAEGEGRGLGTGGRGYSAVGGASRVVGGACGGVGGAGMARVDLMALAPAVSPLLLCLPLSVKNMFLRVEIRSLFGFRQSFCYCFV